MSRPLPKLIARLESIVKGIDRHSRVNPSDLLTLSRVLKMQILKMKQTDENLKKRVLSIRKSEVSK
jgi:hypothetical protein